MEKYHKIPFFRTTIGDEEKRAISDCIDSGWVVLGKKSQEFEEKFADYVGAKHAVFVDSGTSALFLALQQIKRTRPRAFEDQRQVFVPSLTFTSTVEVIVHCGFIPIFVDVERDSFCFDKVPKEKETMGGPFELPVHLTGNKSKKLSRIYDSAHRIERDDVRDLPALWCYSFYATKNLSTVQGGMIATNDKDEYEWLKKARDHGLSKGTRERYTEKVPTYSVDFVGWRVKGDDLRAVIGLEQLKKLPKMTERRNYIVDRYNKNLGLTRTGNHLYPILVKNREKFFDAMNEAGIQCSVHFLPLDLMPAYKQWSPCDHEKGVCKLPNTHYLGERLVSIPLFPQMTDEEIDYVSGKVLETNLFINE